VKSNNSEAPYHVIFSLFPLRHYRTTK